VVRNKPVGKNIASKKNVNLKGDISAEKSSLGEIGNHMPKVFGWSVTRKAPSIESMFTI